MSLRRTVYSSPPSPEDLDNIIELDFSSGVKADMIGWLQNVLIGLFEEMFAYHRKMSAVENCVCRICKPFQDNIKDPCCFLS